MSKPFIIQVVGYKHTGKTTLICKLVELLSSSSLRVATVKHDAHDFAIDREGTDTWRHRQAGAAAVVIASPYRMAVMRREQQPITRGSQDELLQLDHLLLQLNDMDIVLVEGYKSAAYPKIVMVREQAHWRLLDELLNVIAAVYWPEAEPVGSGVDEKHTSLLLVALDEALDKALLQRLRAIQPRQ